jgi:hypothetical protein
VSYAGQGDYTGTPHNAQIVNCWLANGLTQQTSINSVYGLTMDHVVAWADADPVQGAHGCDFDAVANNKRSKFVTIVDCDLNAYGQESMKLENSTDFTISRTLFRQYVTLVQDVLPYDELGRITFSDCTFDADVTLDKLKITLGGGTGGDGSVTWNRCTFTADAMIYCNDSTVANYGTMTITDCVFSREGNSFAFPVGVTVVKSGNLNAELTPKRFARPELDDHGPVRPRHRAERLYVAAEGANEHQQRCRCCGERRRGVGARRHLRQRGGRGQSIDQLRRQDHHASCGDQVRSRDRRQRRQRMDGIQPVDRHRRAPSLGIRGVRGGYPWW